MQKVYNLSKWIELPHGARLQFTTDRPRTVRFEVNAPREVALYVADDVRPEGDGECRFLALVKGRDTIEFSADGAFSLVTAGDEHEPIMVFTADGDDVALELAAPESFTKIVERRRRNPELEYMVSVMERNMHARLQQQAAEFERRFQRGQTAGGDVRPSAGVPGASGEARGEAHVGASSGAQAGESGGGREGDTPLPGS